MAGNGSESIGAYRIVRRLGRGGMGEVYLAYDQRLERLVAVKRIRPDAALDDSRRARFRREARAVARLSHPNVVQIFDILEEEAGDSIVMEYVEGRSLAELLAGGPLEPALAVDVGEQVARGLAAAHARGLVHRDLKSHNVAVDPSGRAKILDFGLAKPLDAGGGTLTENGAVLGTYRSMSPEQAAGEPIDHRSDLFSLGVLIYEMIAGASPFAAATPLDTLQRVVRLTPPPLAEQRTGVPAPLSALADRLLEKDPGRRPASADSVADELAEIAALSGLGGASRPGRRALQPSPSQLADAPTGVVPPPRPSGTPTASFHGPGRRWPSRRRLAAVAALLAVIVAAAVLWRFSPRAARGPLRVAVPAPVDDATGRDAAGLVASGVLVALQRGLLAFETLTPIDPSQIGDAGGSPVDVARAVAADEVLASSIGGEGATRVVALRRIRASDGGVAWAESVSVPARPEDGLVLANAVAAALRRGYGEQPLRDGVPDLHARPEDYAEFLAVKQRVDRGDGALEPELERLDRVVAGSPRFLDAHLLAADLALSIYSDTKEPTLPTRAKESLVRARSLAGDDPSVLKLEIDLALAVGRSEHAEALLGELERLRPGDLRVPERRANIAESQGRLADAIAILREAVANQATWTDLARLADLERRNGSLSAARDHLNQALELVPGNLWVLGKLGRLELVYGDLHRAEEIYLRLVEHTPHRSFLTNLGLARFLLGDYDGAADGYRQALQAEPDHLVGTVNLAGAELARGRRQIAGELYQRALATLEGREQAAPLSPLESTLRAECLVRLGRHRQAVEIALETLQAHPQDAEVTYQAALVFALAGEDASALACVKKARELGIQARWFSIPAFDRLRADPAMLELL